jgi:hypothetical protein
MEPYGTAAELTKLTTWIDEQLADETADRQWIAESASARIKDIALQHLGAAELRRQLGQVLDVFDDDPDAGRIAEVRAVLADFEWGHDDLQYALEAIDRIVTGGDR